MHDNGQNADHLRQQVRSLLPIVIVGFALVLVALLVLLWPNGQWGDDGVVTMPHIVRLMTPLLHENGVNLPRRILDIGIYAVVVAGLVLLVQAWRQGRRNALVGLMFVGILGLSYVSGMALYTGPMIGTCGFMLILFGGLVAWVSTTDPTPTAPDHDGENFTIEPIYTLGTDENATHPVT